MGEKVTPPAASTEALRAKALREARKRGTPPILTQISSGVPSNGTPPPPSLDVEKTYLEQIVENAPEAISILDLDSRIMRINGEFTRLFGFTIEEAREKVIDSLIVPPDRSAETVWIAESVRKENKLSP
jgi:PAS domain-containing protein